MRARIEKVRRLVGKHSFFLTRKTSVAKFSTKHLITPASVVIVAERPLPFEKRECFVARMQRQVLAELTKPIYENHLLFMSYFTRLARKNETLVNASQLLGAKNLDAVGLGYIEHTLLPGHCLITVIGSGKKMNLEQTFSLRPDLKRKPLYKTRTAPDQRIPLHIIQKDTAVWPALHTSFEQEVAGWANAAFYASYVHSQRPSYPLYFLLKPFANDEKEYYESVLKNVKLACERYSLLDHFHPHTGESLGDIVSAQNCTSLLRLFEKLVSPSTQLKKMVGDNPTPQLITKVLGDCYFKVNIKEERNVEMQSSDALSAIFNRLD